MISAATLYWITRLDSIKNFLEGWAASFMIISVIVAITVFLFMYLDSWVEDDDKKKAIKIIKYCILIFILGLSISFVNVFVPTKKEVAFIYVTPIVVNSKFIQEDLPREGKEIYSYFKDYIKTDLTSTNGVLNSILPKK